MKRFAFLMLILAALACNLPGSPEPTAELEPTAEPTTEEVATDVQPEATEPNIEPTAIPPTNVPATAGPTAIPPTATPPFEDNALYGVVMVEEGDVLNVRNGPSPNADKVGELLPIFAAISITGYEQPSQAGDGGKWVPIERLELTGWVNRYYLTEVVSSQDHCANPAAQSIVDDVKTAVQNQDGQLLSSLVHPDRGLLIRHNWWNPEVRFTKNEAASLFTSNQSILWGQQDGSGDDINGTPAEVIVPMLTADLLAENAQQACNEIPVGPTTGLVQTPAEYQGFNYFTVYRPAARDANEFDWGSWVIGIEYRSGVPYLVYLIHFQYEI